MIKPLVAVSTLLLASASANAERTYEYKCWLTLSNGAETIAMLRLDTKGNHGHARAKLARDKVIHTADGVQDVQKVHECVELHKPFISAEANALDQVSVR